MLFNDISGDTLEIEGDSDSLIEVTAEETGKDVSYLAFEPDEAAKIADALYGLVRKPVPGDAVRASEVPLNEALIRVAAAHKANIRFRYAKGGGSPVEAREFAPASVKVFPDHVTFVGFDPDRGALRSFRSDRIKGQVEVVTVSA